MLAISPYLTIFVIAFGSDPNKHYVLITILVQETLLGFRSIYAPNSSSDRTQFWTWLESSLPNVEWILGGDFNMVE